MANLIKINTDNLKSLSSKGVNPKTVELLEGIRKTGGVIKGKGDLVRIGITKDEVEKITPIITFDQPQPQQNIVIAAIETDLKGAPEYSLLIEYQIKSTSDMISDTYFISQLDKTLVKYDDNIAGNNFYVSIKAPTGEFCEIEINGKKCFQAEIKKTDLNGIKIKVTRPKSITTNPNKSFTPSKLKGRLLTNNPSRKLEKIQIVIEVALEKDAKDSYIYFPVCFAVTEQSGYFFTSQIQFKDDQDATKLISARAKIGIINIPDYPIKLDNFSGGVGQLPEKLIIYLLITGHNFSPRD